MTTEVFWLNVYRYNYSDGNLSTSVGIRHPSRESAIEVTKLIDKSDDWRQLNSRVKVTLK